MSYGKVKIYKDAPNGHYIGIIPTTNPFAKKKVKTTDKKFTVEVEKEQLKSPIETKDNNYSNNEPTTHQLTLKEIFNELYDKYKDKSNKEKKNLITNDMDKYFDKQDTLCNFIERNIERKKRNSIVRKIRLSRKVNNNEFNFFVTFTYSDNLHTEESFRKTLMNCLRHNSNRKGWKYIGVWERSPEKKRLHFHALMYIPNDTMKGEIIEVKDFDTRDKKMQKTNQNTFFLEKFGRNDFKQITHETMITDAVIYLTKYLEKSGEKIIYSRGLYQYFVSDILDDDIICEYGENTNKIILFDNFNCWLDGELMGQASKEVIAKMPKCN